MIKKLDGWKTSFLQAANVKEEKSWEKSPTLHNVWVLKKIA
jgi:hypothetical protein